MGKGKNSLKDNKALVAISKSITKKGKIKGKNKQETKALYGICPHHRLGKRNKLKTTVKPDKSGKYLLCKLCGARIRTSFYTKDEVNTAYQLMNDVSNQAKFLTTACRTNTKAIEYWSSLSAHLIPFKKSYSKIYKIANQKSSRIYGKKIKDELDSLGSWEIGTYGKKKRLW